MPEAKRGPQRRPYACIDCGAHETCAKPRARCPACRQRAKRPGVAPRPQENPALPPLGAMIEDDDGERVQCHVCGAFYRSLVSHVTRRHGLTTEQYRERYELNRHQALASPAFLARRREIALERDTAATLREQFAAHGPPSRPPGIPQRLQQRSNVSAAMRQIPHREEPPAPTGDAPRLDPS